MNCRPIWSAWVKVWDQMADNWRVYTGSGKPPARKRKVPDPPPWRTYHGTVPIPDRRIARNAEPNGAKFKARRDVIEAVNAALHLRRPLMLTGRPGSGKSMLIESVANELSLGGVLRWHITSSSTLKEALYGYDAVGRLQELQLTKRAPNITDYLTLGPLGTALLPTGTPRALLIDEIDKADIDLPNDLLNVFERGQFDIPELARVGGRHDIREAPPGTERFAIQDGIVRCAQFPFVVLTSNGERDFPAAFLRRCIRLRMPPPDVELLTEIVTAHLGAQAAADCNDMIRQFATNAESTRALATDQLMNAIYYVTRAAPTNADERGRLVELLQKRLEADQP
jgi:MoxR-like ATPase